MAETLGILVSTDEYPEHLIHIARAAVKRGKRVIVFLTNRGVLLTQDDRFRQLASLAEISLCKVSFEAFGLDPDQPIPGISKKSLATQARHRELIDSADRYLVL